MFLLARYATPRSPATGPLHASNGGMYSDIAAHPPSALPVWLNFTLGFGVWIICLIIRAYRLLRVFVLVMYRLSPFECLLSSGLMRFFVGCVKRWAGVPFTTS